MIGAAVVECDIFLLFSLIFLLFCQDCVFVPLQLCSYDVLCVSIDVQR